MKRSAWILLVLLALVIGAYFLIEKSIENRSARQAKLTPTATSSAFLVSTADGALKSIQINDGAGHVVKLQRKSDGTWVVALPSFLLADQGLAGAAESQASSLLIVASLQNPPDPKVIGLDIPAYIIKLSYASGVEHTIEVGSVTPTGGGYYTRLDGNRINVVSQSGINALLNLLTAPPYLPSATPTETLTPQPSATFTPETPTPETGSATPTH